MCKKKAELQPQGKVSQNRHVTFKLQWKFFDLVISPVIVLFVNVSVAGNSPKEIRSVGPFSRTFFYRIAVL